MIRFLISSVSIDLPRLTEMRMTVTFSPEGRDGTVKNGGMSSGTFANDGGISYLGLHPQSLAGGTLGMLAHSPPPSTHY